MAASQNVLCLVKLHLLYGTLRSAIITFKDFIRKFLLDKSPSRKAEAISMLNVSHDAV